MEKEQVVKDSAEKAAAAIKSTENLEAELAKTRDLVVVLEAQLAENRAEMATSQAETASALALNVETVAEEVAARAAAEAKVSHIDSKQSSKFKVQSR